MVALRMKIAAFFFDKNVILIITVVEALPIFSIHEYPREKTCRTSCTHKEAMVELLGDTQRAFEARLGRRMLSEMVAKARRYSACL